MTPKPHWRKGPPNKPGWWLVITSTGDTVAWQVEWDRDDPSDHPESTCEKYLRFHDDMDSEPVAWHHERWPVRQSYGPIPKAPKIRAKT